MAARHLFASALIAFYALPAAAQTFNVKGIEVTRPYATPTVAAAPTGAVYLSVHNKAGTADKLTGASTPRAKRVELHGMSMSGNVMRMREVGAIEIGAGESVRMRPGSGHHLMLVGLVAPLKAGEQFPITLQFQSAGSLRVNVVVEQPPAERPAADDHHRH
jgi:copper(I)-binding protein